MLDHKTVAYGTVKWWNDFTRVSIHLQTKQLIQFFAFEALDLLVGIYQSEYALSLSNTMSQFKNK
jgi:hypothetical protein